MNKKQIKSLDGHNLAEQVSVWLHIRELVENPFPQSDIKERWNVLKKGIKKSLNIKISTVKDMGK